MDGAEGVVYEALAVLGLTRAVDRLLALAKIGMGRAARADCRGGRNARFLRPGGWNQNTGGPVPLRFPVEQRRLSIARASRLLREHPALGLFAGAVIRHPQP